MKPNQIRIIGPKTCRAIYKITNDINHYNKCPIIMSRSAWESIEGMVKREKMNPTKDDNPVKDFMNSIFSGFK